jgi:hypothetical protein
MHLVSGTELAKPAISSGPQAGDNICSARQSVVTSPNGATWYAKSIALTGNMFDWITEYILSNIKQNIVSSGSLSNAAVIRSPLPSNQIADFINSVEEMKYLHVDWNGYNSEAPNKFARDMAESVLLSAARVIIPNRVAPSAQGGVGICFYNGDRYGDIECLNTGEILATISDGSGRPLVWEVRPSETWRALERISAYINST